MPSMQLRLAQRPLAQSPHDRSDDEPAFEEDDSELDPLDEPWDPFALEDDDEEPEPEYGDFWQEPDDFDD